MKRVSYTKVGFSGCFKHLKVMVRKSSCLKPVEYHLNAVHFRKYIFNIFQAKCTMCSYYFDEVAVLTCQYGDSNNENPSDIQACSFLHFTNSLGFICYITSFKFQGSYNYQSIQHTILYNYNTIK